MVSIRIRTLKFAAGECSDCKRRTITLARYVTTWAYSISRRRRSDEFVSAAKHQRGVKSSDLTLNKKANNFALLIQPDILTYLASRALGWLLVL